MSYSIPRNLMSETLIISVTMILLCGFPLFSSRLRSHSRLFFLLGTGALSGLLAFDLLPDVVQMGGAPSLWVMGCVWAAYSVAHLAHLTHHRHDPRGDSPETEGCESAPVFLLASMMAHCLASGMLLAISDGLGTGFGHTVFLTLIAHKGYEALTVSTILIERQKSRPRILASVTAYALSLPAGVALALFFRADITQRIALLATSLAAGTLLGCLVFDFLIPSFHHIKHRKLDLGWVVAGLLMTQLLMWSLQ